MSDNPTEAVAADASFEAAYDRLASIVRDLESGRLSLDDGLTAYEGGVAALKHCYRILEGAERRLELLVAREDGTVEAEPVDLAVLRKEARGETGVSMGRGKRPARAPAARSSAARAPAARSSAASTPPPPAAPPAAPASPPAQPVRPSRPPTPASPQSASPPGLDPAAILDRLGGEADDTFYGEPESLPAPPAQGGEQPTARSQASPGPKKKQPPRARPKPAPPTDGDEGGDAKRPSEPDLFG